LFLFFAWYSINVLCCDAEVKGVSKIILLGIEFDSITDSLHLGITTENIYGIPSEKEKQLVQIKKLAKVKSAKLALKNKNLKEQI
jgi:hypothetical protein